MVLSGVWNEVATVLRSLSNVLPEATKTLKSARLEVSKLAANLDSLFKPFETAGPRIFDDFSQTLLMVYSTYFCILLPLMLVLVVYGFWAGGYFGGPGNAEREVHTGNESPDDQGGIIGRLGTCWQACSHCCRGFHDWSMGFWSCLIVMQLVAVLVFLVALILLIFGSVQAYIASGCQQMYILGDELVCGQTLHMLRSFLHTFKADWLVSDMPKTCVREELLVCKSISGELKSSAMLTSVFGFLAAIFSFMLVVESATLHARAMCRREVVKDA
jgi:hypothetical protein